MSDSLVRAGLTQIVSVSLRKNDRWNQTTDHDSYVLEYKLEVPTSKTTKSITLAVGYNTFENRKEPTNSELSFFSPDFIANARTNYWPSKPKTGELYPSYFLQAQFDECDVLVSKMPGDFGLLQFDYARAAQRTTVVKPRVVLTEHIEKLYSLKASMPNYSINVRPLTNNNYGYCHHSQDCVAGVLSLTPSRLPVVSNQR